MMEINKKIYIVIITIMFIIILYMSIVNIQLSGNKYYISRDQNRNNENTSNCNICDVSENINNDVNNKTIVNENRYLSDIDLIDRDINFSDEIRNYDYFKMFDPLEEPTRRVNRYEIQPIHLKTMIDIPTRGYPDNYILMGILRKSSKLNNKNDQNDILKLFGRQEYPRSCRYEYYTLINSGLDQIKIPINKSKKELYNDDKVYIEELNETYKVKLYKYDAPKYYPDIL